jgi:hypothetical protein
VFHDGQRLALGIESRDDLRRVHPQLDDFQGDLAADRTGLLGQPDDAHAALADLLQQAVRPDGGGRAGRRCL